MSCFTQGSVIALSGPFPMRRVDLALRPLTVYRDYLECVHQLFNRCQATMCQLSRLLRVLMMVEVATCSMV